MCGAPGVLPWPRQAGGVAVWGTEGGGREGGYRGGVGGEAFDGPGAVGWSPVGTAIRRGSDLWPGVPMGWKATEREGGGARAYLQSVVTNVDARGEEGVGRRLEPDSMRKGLM